MKPLILLVCILAVLGQGSLKVNDTLNKNPLYEYFNVLDTGNPRVYTLDYIIAFRLKEVGFSIKDSFGSVMVKDEQRTKETFSIFVKLLNRRIAHAGNSSAHNLVPIDIASLQKVSTFIKESGIMEKPNEGQNALIIHNTVIGFFDLYPVRIFGPVEWLHKALKFFDLYITLDESKHSDAKAIFTVDLIFYMQRDKGIITNMDYRLDNAKDRPAFLRERCNSLLNTFRRSPTKGNERSIEILTFFIGLWDTANRKYSEMEEKAIESIINFKEDIIDLHVYHQTSLSGDNGVLSSVASDSATAVINLTGLIATLALAIFY